MDCSDTLVMEHHTRTNHPRQSRQPLRDAPNRANLHQLHTQRSRPTPPSVSMEKLDKPTAVDRKNCSSPDSPVTPVTPIENKRISAVVDSQPSSSNRNSAISTCSTASTKSRRKTHIGPWQLGRTLGKGSTGRVRLAKHAMTGQSAAIKIVSKKSAAMAQSQSIAAIDKNIKLSTTAAGTKAIPSGIEREVVIMKLIQHPNVIGLYDVWENRGELYLVLEYVEGGELFDYVSSDGPLPEVEAVRLFRQIIAGLSYCHRFNICHRDLKPENILLDGQRNIKLADFGMAALQPAGHWLNTSCGSPHYASPEIIYGKRYQGDKADIWSCGIILFALLTGFLPFDGGDLKNTLKLVKKGEYILPPWLSLEAVDLIQCILQKRPDDRISMQDMWIHPLLRKYEDHPLFADKLSIAPPLSSKGCGGGVVSRRQDIDMDILRSLQALWHGSRSEELIDKLLNNEANHEKLFYSALRKFRDDQLENYESQYLEYSGSDYHHAPASKSTKKPMSGLHSDPYSWRRSRCSVGTDASGYKEDTHQTPRSLQTISSYDPFRSSQTPIPNPQAEFANVTIHRESSGILDSSSPFQSPLPTRLQSNDQSSINPQSSLNPIPARYSRKNSMASFQSYSSVASSQQRYKPFAPKLTSYKRNVSFKHLHNTTANNGRQRNRDSHSSSQYSLCRDRSTPPAQGNERDRLSSPDRFSSPSLPTPPRTVRKRREVTKQGDVIDKRKARASWREDARKVSAELGQMCEEAFNQSSVSSVRTVETASKERSESPMTSISSPDDSSSRINKDYAQKPTLDEPIESSRHYATKELTETRRRLVEHSAQATADGLPQYLSEVISHLDRLIDGEPSSPTSRIMPVNKDISVASRTVSGQSGRLPVISEENQNTEDSGPISNGNTQTKSLANNPRNQDGKKTIRVVTDDANPHINIIRPLTIRKKNKAPPVSLEQDRTDHFGLLQLPDDISGRTGHTLPSSRRSSAARFHLDLEPIEENPKSARSSEVRSSGETKKWSWFRHRSQGSEESVPSTPPSKFENKPWLHAGKDTIQVDQQKSLRELIEDQNSKDLRSSKKGNRFFKLFGKKKQEKRVHELARGINDLDDDAGLDAASITSQAGTDKTNKTDNVCPDSDVNLDLDLSPCSNKASNIPFNFGNANNWFSKFLHIKPATKVLALHLSKPRAKKEIVKILREWKKYGMEDVHIDKKTGIVHGTVGSLNFLRLRPVQFSAEFYTVLEYGRHVGLSLVRLRQEQGAASSFNKVVETLSMVLRRRKYLIKDSSRAKKMAKVLDI